MRSRVCSATRRVRADVIEALVRHGDRVVDRLIEQLRADDRDIRHAAIVALGRVGSPRATPALVAMLERDDELLVAIAGALARIGDNAAFEPLLACSATRTAVSDRARSVR